jgi:hypothetical protein
MVRPAAHFAAPDLISEVAQRERRVGIPVGKFAEVVGLPGVEGVSPGDGVNGEVVVTVKRESPAVESRPGER